MHKKEVKVLCLLGKFIHKTTKEKIYIIQIKEITLQVI